MIESKTYSTIYSKKTLLEIVRNIQTLEGMIPIYKESIISFKRFHPNNVSPIAKYVLTPNLERLQSTQRDLFFRGYNIFSLKETLKYNNHIISPPIIEYSDADKKNIIVDGIHRFYLARQLGHWVSTIYIQKVNEFYPVIGMPVEWNDVIEYSEPPQEVQNRRRLREGIENKSEILRKFYRDYSVIGSTGRRPILGQNG